MACIVAIDVANRFICRSDYFYRKYIVQIFCTPVFFSGSNCVRNQSLRFLVSTHLHILCPKALCKNRKESILHFLMHQKRLTGIADTHPLCLGIHHNVCRHLKICALIHINMAVSGTSFDYRNRAVIYYCFNKTFAPSWNQHIHIFVHLHEFSGSLS